MWQFHSRKIRDLCFSLSHGFNSCMTSWSCDQKYPTVKNVVIATEKRNICRKKCSIRYGFWLSFKTMTQTQTQVKDTSFIRRNTNGKRLTKPRLFTSWYCCKNKVLFGFLWLMDTCECRMDRRKLCFFFNKFKVRVKVVWSDWSATKTKVFVSVENQLNFSAKYQLN